MGQDSEVFVGLDVAKSLSRLSGWRDAFLAAGEAGLASYPANVELAVLGVLQRIEAGRRWEQGMYLKAGRHRPALNAL